jgi:5-methylcytosine-specific restriction endonuclease McrA
MRNSFLPLIPELQQAADLLDEAADALIRGDLVAAGEFVVKADLAAICRYAAQITGSIDQKIHWQSKLTRKKYAVTVRQDRRMPSTRDELRIFTRDGWRCRYCGTRVIYKKARSILTAMLPNEARWGRANSQKHCALAALTASLDHIVGHSRGGTNECSNLVTACGPCQYGRNDWSLEEVGFNDPRIRPPILDRWDGLTRLMDPSVRPSNSFKPKPLRGAA